MSSIIPNVMSSPTELFEPVVPTLSWSTSITLTLRSYAWSRSLRTSNPLTLVKTRMTVMWFTGSTT